MYEVEKLDNVTWYGHCVVHVMAALKDLPDEAKLLFGKVCSASATGAPIRLMTDRDRAADADRVVYWSRFASSLVTMILCL